MVDRAKPYFSCPYNYGGVVEMFYVCKVGTKHAHKRIKGVFLGRSAPDGIAWTTLVGTNQEQGRFFPHPTYRGR